jgi:C-terminal processing protease CtpA/Prc
MPGKCSYLRPMNATPCSYVVTLLIFVLALSGCRSSWAGSVGANFGKDNRDGRLYAREVPADMPAARAGLRVGDEIVTIDGKPVAAMSPDDVDAAFHGKVGSVVVLRVHRHGDEIDVRIERGPLR